MHNAIAYAQTRQERQLSELLEFIQIPSVSTQPEHDADSKAAAAWLADKMRAAGLENVQIIETRRQPLVYADWLHAGAEMPTVLIYGHYDVQPAEPLELWDTPPFEATVVDDFLYGRGTSDDKGQLYIHVKAAEAYLHSKGRLPVNVKFIVEGEEESGGESLAEFIPQNKGLLAAEVAMVSDTSIISQEQPAIVYGLRGMCYAYVDITGPGRDLHSGSYGGGIDNPLNVLAHLIARLKDGQGRILIPGFYDRVRPLDQEEREALAQYPLDETAWLAGTGAPQAWGEPDYALIERLGARPTLDVNGIIGGYTGPGAKTVLPSHAHAKISMRLVPDQEPEEIARLFEQYLRAIAPPSVRLELSFRRGSPACIIDRTIPAMRAAAAAYTHVFGRAPVYKREGGSIPVVGHLQKHLGLETVLMGFGLPGDNLHAPNERFSLLMFYRGIETSIRFLAEYARLSR